MLGLQPLEGLLAAVAENEFFEFWLRNVESVGADEGVDIEPVLFRFRALGAVRGVKFERHHVTRGGDMHDDAATKGERVTPPSAGAMQTPVSTAPTMPPIPWTPKTSKLSSYPSDRFIVVAQK